MEEMKFWGEYIVLEQLNIYTDFKKASVPTSFHVEKSV